MEIRFMREAYYDGLNYSGSRWFGIYCALYPIIQPFWLRNLLCRMFGHRLDCNGDISPDHGIEQIYCKRCGWTHRIVWY